MDQEQVCDSEEPLHIGVIVLDEDRRGVPGLEVWLTWARGTDRAVTGLKPDRGLGYADFSAQPDTAYSISVGQLGMPIVSGLQLEDCPAQIGEEEALVGSWHVVLAPEG